MPYRLLSSLLFLSCFFIVSGCGSKKSVSKETVVIDERPSWVKARPLRPDAYIGIGSAPKLRLGSEHQIQAKNQALNDLASEISIEISGSSLLYQMEDNANYRESFQSNVKTRTAAMLSGYEVADIYEDDRQYWVMYVLDKAQYARDKEKRKEKAVALALFHRTEAIGHLEEGEDILAIENYLKALEDIHDFWNESLRTNIDGAEDFLGNRLFAELSSAVRGISVVPNVRELEWKIGKAIPRGLLGFQLLSHDGQALSNSPVFLNLSGYRLKPNQLRTNEDGRVFIDAFPKGLQAGRTTLTCTLNLVALIDASTNDPMIGMMANTIDPARSSSSIFFQNPSIRILSNERAFGQAVEQHALEDELKAQLLREGYSVVNEKEDLVLEVESDVRQGNQMDKFYSVFLDARIRLFDGKGQLLSDVELEDIKGVQLSYEKAADDAYSKATSEIRKRYYRDLMRSAFD